jgi:hypothetical protein
MLPEAKASAACSPTCCAPRTKETSQDDAARGPRSLSSVEAGEHEDEEAGAADAGGEARRPQRRRGVGGLRALACGASIGRPTDARMPRFVEETRVLALGTGFAEVAVRSSGRGSRQPVRALNQGRRRT